MASLVYFCRRQAELNGDLRTELTCLKETLDGQANCSTKGCTTTPTRGAYESVGLLESQLENYRQRNVTLELELNDLKATLTASSLLEKTNGEGAPDEVDVRRPEPLETAYEIQPTVISPS